MMATDRPTNWRTSHDHGDRDEEGGGGGGGPAPDAPRVGWRETATSH